MLKLFSKYTPKYAYSHGNFFFGYVFPVTAVTGYVSVTGYVTLRYGSVTGYVSVPP